MKRDRTLLITVWSLAGASLVAGVALSLTTLASLGRTRDLWSRKAADASELAALKATADWYQAILDRYATLPARAEAFDSLARAACPGLSMTTITTATLPCVPGWTARKISVECNALGGEDLEKLLVAAAGARPPWALVEGTVFSATTPGRIAKATLVFETVER